MTTFDTHPLRILLVDDDRDDCDLFRDALAETGLHTNLKIAYDCSGIMQSFSTPVETLPHLIFLDLNMPVISGRDCLLQIRQTNFLNNIPVIIFSNSCTAEEVEDSFVGEASLYLQKPSGFQHLVDTLKKVLQLDWRKYLNERHRSNFVISDRIPA